MPIVLQETLRAPFYAPFYAALALGAYRQEGLEVRLVTAPTPAAAARGLADGSADVAWGGPMRSTPRSRSNRTSALLRPAHRTILRPVGRSFR